MGDTASTIKRQVKRNMYRWHRILGIMTVIPVIFWTCSGLSHPVIAHWFKVPLAHEYIKPELIDRSQVKLSIQQVLSKNGINLFSSCRLVQFGGHTYYQVKNRKNEISYFSAADARKLLNGEALYAAYLGRYFLGDSTSHIRSMTKITSFNGEYQYVNRLLPVWKLSFDRKDKMDIYVETAQSRLANYNDSNRKIFLWVFSNFHSFAFIEKISNNAIRYMVILVFAGIVIFSTLSGLLVYAVLWKRFKKPATGQKIGFLRRNHRVIGIAVSLVTLSFIGSGAYHATRKFKPDDRINYVVEPEINNSQLAFPSGDLPLKWDGVSNIAVVRFDNKTYYQVKHLQKNDDSWKKQQVAKAETFEQKEKKNKPDMEYYDAATGQLLPDGIMEHSYSLVKHFVAQGAADGEAACCEMMANAAADESAPLIISSSAFLSKFDSDYGFINKRLPVVKIALSTPTHLTYYLEPATGRLAAKVQDSDRREGLSFAVFHKYLLVDFAGKNFRDFLTAFAAMGVLVVSVLGLILFIKTN